MMCAARALSDWLRSTTWLLRNAVLLAVVLSVAAGNLSAQSPDRKRKRAHRIFAAQTGPDQVTLVWDEVAGATEYRIYLPGPPTPTTRPTRSLSGSSRQTFVQGVQKLAGGAYLVAVGAGQVLYQGTFNPVTRAPLTPISAPASVQAQETGETEVTVSWDHVPGATAYMIGRSVAPEGLRMACHLCPPTAEYVDTAAIPGTDHTYTVQAVFPTGISSRTRSNRILVGAAQLAAATPSSQTSASTPTGTPTSTPTSTPATTPPGAPEGTATMPAPTSPSPTPQPAPDSVPTLVNPQITAIVRDTTPPPIGPAASGADTSSCVVVATAPEPAAGDTLERIDTRADRIDTRTTPNPDATIGTGTVVAPIYRGSAEYQKGKCLNPGAPGYPAMWDAVASTSGLASAEQIAAWKEIGVVALEYRHILDRLPTPEEARRDVTALRAGTTWQQLWRQLAHSAERDTRFGYWAPAPIPDSLQAQRDFGLTVPPWTAQQCFGGLGPKCGGGIPPFINDNVAPYWSEAFYMPDNTQLAYVDMGVAVGSILHDNACLKDKGGLNCNGLGLGDFVKIGPLWAAGLEWNKAAWNVMDGRTWRARFGPYPTNAGIRDYYWYDDLRPVTTRPTMMAPVIVSQLAWPGLTVTYTGGETVRSRALLAPAGTSLDATDVAFCRSGAFGSVGSFIGKAPWGICAQGEAAPAHAASPPATGTPATGTSTPAASCKLDYQRADNMWAAAGRPDGFLGVESISLAAGEHKVFVTDWKYEKQRNDGTTYYGSHLRLATNKASLPIRLQLIAWGGATTSFVRLDPNTTREFREDLRDVFCEQ